jgi:hypothetical protein
MEQGGQQRALQAGQAGRSGDRADDSPQNGFGFVG